jgi:hypothetical protein
VADQAVGVDRTVVAKATTEALAEGIATHLPGTVGLLLKGPLICAFMAFGHFILGTDWPLSVVVGGLCGLTGVNIPSIVPRLNRPRAAKADP